MATYRNKSIKTELQIGAMKRLYPQFKATKKKTNSVEFVGTLQPKPEFRKFMVSISYRGDANPLVKVLSPSLVENPPHFYKGSGTLCLYHPKDFKWRKNMLIAKYIVPITAAWLYFYEVWLEKNIWYGPEAEHRMPKTESNE